jgi:glycine oxidase
MLRSMRTVEVIVVGQGLAGTALAWQLRRRGRSVLVVGRESVSSPSRVASGLMTPVTGKRLARSWRWDELYPTAVGFYRMVESATASSFLHQKPALRLFADEREREKYHGRVDNVLAGLVREAPPVPGWFEAPLGGFEMPDAARLDAARYLDASREAFALGEGYVEEMVDLRRDVELVPGGVRLPRLGVQAAVLALCCGYAPAADPWFGTVRYNAVKGELLTLRVPGLAETRVVHRGVWLAPLGGELFRAGSTFNWDDLRPEPSAAGRAEIEERIRAFLRLPFEVVEHRAAVRPVIDAGYPVLGRHPEFRQVAYFNGLGSKGALLAPFFAAQLAWTLAGEGEVEADVDVKNLLRK